MYRTIVCAAAALFIASQAEAQTLKQLLVGSWLLTSFQFTDRNGSLHQFPTIKGIFIFDANGRYAEIVGREDRPKFKGAIATTEELAANTRDFFGANAGTWSVNESDKTLTFRLELSLRPNNQGTDIKYSISLVEDQLKLAGMTTVASGAKEEFILQRAR